MAARRAGRARHGRAARDRLRVRRGVRRGRARASRASTCRTATSTRRSRGSATAASAHPADLARGRARGGARRGGRRAPRPARRPRRRRRNARAGAVPRADAGAVGPHARREHPRNASSSPRRARVTSSRRASRAASSCTPRSSAAASSGSNNIAYTASKAALDPGGRAAWRSSWRRTGSPSTRSRRARRRPRCWSTCRREATSSRSCAATRPSGGSGIPLGRLADPADQAALAVFLAGEGGRHITGQDLAVDGGQTTV